jgi:hypothetical protein
MATKTTVFNSFSPNQQVIVQAGRPEARDVNNRVVAQFIPEIRADFSHNQLETDDSKVIDYLKNHDDFNSPRGWWLEGSAPDEPKPTRTDQGKAVARAAARGDVDKLRAVLDEERATHNRPDVIASAEEALANILVPAAEEHGAIGRADEPAEEAAGLPRVDPPDTTQGRVEPEVDRERIIKSEEVAEQRANAVAAQTFEEPDEEPKGPVEEKLLAEVDVVDGPDQPEGEKLPEKLAKAGKAPAPQGKRPAKGSTSKKAKAEAEAIRKSSTDPGGGSSPVPAVTPPDTGQRTADTAEPDTGTGPYENRTLAQLQAVAAQQDLAGRSGMTKDQLVVGLRGESVSEGASKSKSTAKGTSSGANARSSSS